MVDLQVGSIEIALEQLDHMTTAEQHLRRTVHGGSNPQVAPLMAALRRGEANNDQNNEAKLKVLISKLVRSVSHGLTPEPPDGGGD